MLSYLSFLKEIPSAQHLHPLLMQVIDPNSGDVKQVEENTASMVLYGSYNTGDYRAI